MATLAQRHDCLLVDLDGTVFRGDQPTPGAALTLAEAPGRTLFVTNNASRSSDEVAEKLNRLGLQAVADDIVTSAQTAAHLLAARLPAGARVLVVGADALAAEIAGVALRPVRSWADEPVAVVQGHSPATGWEDLAEAALAIRHGALWMATNVDRTLPTERGLLPGNGAMVAALRAATDAEPEVAGKPSPALLTDAMTRGQFHRPLVVGDRLDTDIAAANAAGLPSVMVLTGVSSARDAIAAAVGRRPTYLAVDLRSLHEEAESLAVAAQPDWLARVDGSTVTVDSASAHGGDGLGVVRAVARAVWDADVDARSVTVEPGDDAAREALQHWSLR